MTKNIEIKSIIITLAILSIVGLISIKFLGEYGWTIFVLIPILMGFLPSYMVSRYKTVTRKTAYKLGFSALGISFVALLVFAIEGIICIVMASPIAALLTCLGAYIGYSFQGEKALNSTKITILIIFSAVGLMSFDYANEPKGLIPIRTKVIVDAGIETVWKNVVTFNEIREPIDWIFKTGIAYPTDATIKGTGVGAIRYCNFSTGSFVEPITTWNKPNLLQFDVKEQPIPMNELNPFWDVHPPHLDGYFKSYKGQFKLTELANDKTALEGTTWYQVNITPEIYWKIWSNTIIHKIHERVLNHIKQEAEKNKNATKQ